MAINVGKDSIKEIKKIEPKNKTILSLLKKRANKASINGNIPMYPTNSA